jgi:hypothetical protein
MSRLTSLLTSRPPLSIPQPTETLFSFKLFPKLAPELRLKIWTYAACQPRTLLLSDNWDAPATDPNRKVIENGNDVPAILYTCSEARQEGLKHYTACTKRNSKHNNTHADQALNKSQSPNHKVYINFNADRFLVSEDQSWWDGEEQVSLTDFQLEPQDMAKIQTLDLPWHEWDMEDTPGVVLLRLAQDLVELNLIYKGLWHMERCAFDYFAYNVGAEISIRKHEEHLRAKSKDSRTWLMGLTGIQPGDGGDLLLFIKKGMKLAFKRHFVPEEWDLHPVSATAAEVSAAIISTADLDETY